MRVVYTVPKVRVPKRAVARSLFRRTQCGVDLNRCTGLRERAEVRGAVGGAVGGGGVGR